MCGSAALMCVISSAPGLRPIRAGSFVLAGFTGVLPTSHFLYSHGLSSEEGWTLGAGVFVMGMLYLGGAILYATRVPERCAPGRFDIFGASHQLFHVAVVFAAVVHYNTSI